MPPKAQTKTGIPKSLHDKLGKIVQNASAAGLLGIEQSIKMLRSELLAQMEGVRSNATNEIKVANNMLQSLKEDIESATRSIAEDKPTLKAVADTMERLDQMQTGVLDKQREMFILLQEYRDTLKELKQAMSPANALAKKEEPPAEAETEPEAEPEVAEEMPVPTNAKSANANANRVGGRSCRGSSKKSVSFSNKHCGRDK